MSEIDKLKELMALREKAKINESLFVTYEEFGRLDDLKLNGFLLHGHAEEPDDAEVVCVDEDPLELDGPPSPRLEYLAAAANIDLPALLKAFEEMRIENERLRGKAALYDAYKAGEQDRADMVARALPAHFGERPQALTRKGG